MWSFISWVLPIILTIPIGIAINIITPRVQNWLAARALTRTSKRIKVLKSELEKATYYHNNLSKLYMQSAIVVFIALFSLFAGSIASEFSSVFTEVVSIYSPHYLFGFPAQRFWLPTIGGISLLMSWLSTILYLTAFIIILNHLRILVRVRDFEEYKKTVAGQINNIERKAPAVKS